MNVSRPLLLFAERGLVAGGELVVRGVFADERAHVLGDRGRSLIAFERLAAERVGDQLLVAGDRSDLGGLLVEVVLARVHVRSAPRPLTLSSSVAARPSQ